MEDDSSPAVNNPFFMNPGDVRIFPAIAGDLDEILALYRDLHESDPPASDEALKAAFTEILDDPGTRLYLLRAGGIAVSSCVLHIHANLTRQARPYGLIENVVTAKGYRNRGYGTCLLMRALDDAWNGGCYKVMLLSGRKDTAVFRLYEKAGFRRGYKEGFIAYPPGETRISPGGS